MRKYPFSKKAMSLLLATALVVTPAATLGPIGGGVAQAQEKSEILQLAEDFELFYKHTIPGDFAAAQTIINDNQINIPVPPDLTTEEAKAYKAILKNITEIVYQKHDASSLETAVNKFKGDQSTNFNTLFGDDVSAQDLIDFAKAMKTRFKSNPITYVQGDYNAAFLKLVRDTRDHGGFVPLNNIIKTHLNGHGLEELFQDQSVINNSVDGNRAARNAMVASAFTETATFNLSGTQPVGSSLEFVLTVSYELSSGVTGDLHLTTAVDWYVNGSKIERNAHTFPTADTYLVEAKLKDRDTTIFTTNLVVGSSGGINPTPPITAPPGPTPPPVTPPVPERPGQSTDATNTTTVEREQTTTGQTKAVSTVNGESLASVIAANPNADRIGFTLERAASEVAELRLPKAAVEALLGATNTNLVVDIDSADGSVSIPVSELAEEKLRAALGLSEDEADFEVSISVSQASAAEAAAVTERLAADTRNLQARSAVIDFSMTVRSGDREVAITNFDSYVFREIPVSGLVNVDNAVAYNVDAEPVAVPTQVGTERVRFASLAFSKYVVVEREPVTFSDLTNTHWAKESIDRLAIRDVIVGFADGEVKPSRVTTRAEFAAMLTRSLALPEAGNYNGRFSDVKGNEWYVESLIPAVEAGLLEGRANGTFGANDPITRQEAAAVVSRALSFLNVSDDALDAAKSVDSFPDVARIAPWAKADVERAVQAGILKGHANGTFEARGDTQRAQVAAMIERLLKKGSLL